MLKKVRFFKDNFEVVQQGGKYDRRREVADVRKAVDNKHNKRDLEAGESIARRLHHIAAAFTCTIGRLAPRTLKTMPLEDGDIKSGAVFDQFKFIICKLGTFAFSKGCIYCENVAVFISNIPICNWISFFYSGNCPRPFTFL